MNSVGVGNGRLWTAVLILVSGSVPALGQDPGAAPSRGAAIGPFVARYCAGCHNGDDKASAAGLDLEQADPADLERQAAAWEKVVRRLAARQMPPVGWPRPTEAESEAVVAEVAGRLDRAAAERPDPGRTDTLRRLNRTEYRNAIRDLLCLDIDAATLLPRDESSLGFDNVTVGDLSPTLLDRYVAAAQAISRMAVGTARRAPGGDTFRVPADRTQEEHVEGLPIGTRGGALIPYNFPRDGVYEVQVRLARDRNEHVEGMRESHEVEILLDRERRAAWTVAPPKSERDHQALDDPLKVRLSVAAGPHAVGVTFPKGSAALLETKRQPYQAHYNMHRHPRLSPAVFQVSIVGPFDSPDVGSSPSRRRLFGVEAPREGGEEVAARAILAPLVRRAFRRPVAEDDLRRPLEFFRRGRAGGDFDAGIEFAVSSVLVSPQFLFRVEADPPGVEPGAAYRLSDIELASRLSFFLWSSIPDDELLDRATRGELSRPEVLREQVHRMLADPRASNLATNFAGQWLHLRNLESITPDLRLFPDFDDNLRQAFRRETELHVEELIRDDRSVLDLLRSDHTFLNERLARHYGIPHVLGSHFRRVDVGPDGLRGGLLRQGGVLMVTSYATRTSPVIRGKWVLENLLGTPPPPPPPNIPALKDNPVDASLPVRARLAEHRRDAACAGCHALMDPVGFALENFDAVGRWRDVEEGQPVDAAGGLPSGEKFGGVAGLEAGLLAQPEQFVGTLTEKLLTFALGRAIGPGDAPAVRRIVRDARATRFKFSSLVEGIATSVPFQMRRAE